MIRRSLAIALTLVFALWSLSAFAGGPQTKPVPPKPADACQGKSEGQSCSITVMSAQGARTVPGTCVKANSGPNPLVCKPKKDQ